MTSSTPVKYAVLTEVHGGLDHTFYYFLRYNGNEKQLQFLQEQLEKVEEMCIYDDDSMYFLDLENLVSETTAKEMCLIDTGDYYHRKFDGEMKMIDFRFSKRDDDEDKLNKINDLLYEGLISEFISKEDTFGRDIEHKEHKIQKETEEKFEDEEEEIRHLRKKLEKLEKQKQK